MQPTQEWIPRTSYWPLNTEEIPGYKVKSKPDAQPDTAQTSPSPEEKNKQNLVSLSHFFKSL